MSAVTTGTVNPGVKIFKQVKQEATNGRPPIQYRIQLVDESMIEEATQFMMKNFLPNENIVTAIDIMSEKEGIDGIYSIWKEHISEGISLAGVLEDAQGNRGPMISCNVLHIVTKKAKDSEHSQIPIKSKKLEKTLEVLEAVEAKADVFALYNCEAYLHAMGLSVASDHERRGIGGEMLRTRAEICRMTNTPVSATVFTANTSQKLAARCGYESLAELDLTDYQIDGELVYHNLQYPVIRWMAKRYF